MIVGFSFFFMPAPILRVCLCMWDKWDEMRWERHQRLKSFGNGAGNPRRKRTGSVDSEKSVWPLISACSRASCTLRSWALQTPHVMDKAAMAVFPLRHSRRKQQNRTGKKGDLISKLAFFCLIYVALIELEALESLSVCLPLCLSFFLSFFQESQVNAIKFKFRTNNLGFLV